VNIFYLDSNPLIAAQYHVDRHVIKMILESAQLLCTAHRVIDGIQTKVSRLTKTGKHKQINAYLLNDSAKNSLLYSVTHINHPCTIWCRDNINNYMWLYELFVSLCDEYTYRYGKKHKTDFLLRDVLQNSPISISTSEFTQPAQAMPEKYRSADSIQAYRQYYIHEKHSFAKWSKRATPEWFI
jgi:hypothetical protein